MPVYEYTCNKCNAKFEVEMMITEKRAGKKPKCPKCKSSSITQIIGNCSVITNSCKIKSTPVCGENCSSCGHK